MNEISNVITLFLPDEVATQRLAGLMAETWQTPLVVWLEGGLGAGKSTLVRAFLRALGYEGAVKSPTYAIMESYQLSPWALHHFDLYRFTSPEEWHEAGLDDLMAEAAWHFIEWPQQGGEFTPASDIQISLITQDAGRRCDIAATSLAGKQSLALWQKLLDERW